MEGRKISTSNALVRVKTDDIVYVAAAGNYSDLVLADGQRHTLVFQLHYFEEAFRQLRRNHFVRVGRSIIVNRHFVFNLNLSDKSLLLAGFPLAKEMRLNASREALK